MGGETPSGKREDVVRTWERHPGRLAERTLQAMHSLCGIRGAGSSESREVFSPVARKYLHTILFSHHPRGEMGLRTARELETLCLIVDELLAKRTSSALDILLQRLKALERTLIDQNWNVSRWFELIPTTEALLSKRRESMAALTAEKVDRLIKKGPHEA